MTSGNAGGEPMGGIFNSDLLLTLFKLGPPGLLILCLVVILYLAVQGSLSSRDGNRNGRGITRRDAITYSSITAVFFILWLVSIPLLRLLDPQQIDIKISASPKTLLEIYTLHPIKYKLGKRELSDLSDDRYDFPTDRLVSVDFSLDELIASYNDNERALYIVAIEDPRCFSEQSRGASPIQLPPLLHANCQGAFVKWSHEHKPAIELPQ